MAKGESGLTVELEVRNRNGVLLSVERATRAPDSIAGTATLTLDTLSWAAMVTVPGIGIVTRADTFGRYRWMEVTSVGWREGDIGVLALEIEGAGDRVGA